MSFVITGTPGVGKHTIAKKITKELQLRIIDINKIAQECGLFEISEETNEVDVSKLKELILDKISVPGLIVGHLAPYVLSSDQVKKVIVLRKNPYELIPIYRERKYSEQKIKDNLGSEVLGIILHDAVIQFGEEKILQIDATGKNINEITKKIMDSINGKIKDDYVDWLTSVSDKNDLKEFFAY
ncbi:MAG: AAA family ATPase [Nitrosopumilus sp.]|nr:AAA family ATPase [Nitrosopumilus sp.]